MPATTDKTSMSLREQFKSLDYIYWLANWMELVERFAYYGVRVISPLFFVAALDEGGLELTQIQKGQVWAVWAIMQSFVPILSGGPSARSWPATCMKTAVTRWALPADADPNHPFNTRGDTWVKAFLVPISAILIATSCFFPSIALILITLFFCMMLVFALTPQKPASSSN